MKRNRRHQLPSYLVGGDYDSALPPPMVPQTINHQLQDEASELPEFLPGESILSYHQEHPEVAYNDMMTAYSAMINRTSYKDPGNPVDVDNAVNRARQKRVADAFTKGLTNEVTDQVVNDALNRVNKGADAIAGLIPGSEEVETARTLTNIYGNTLGLPTDLSDAASAQRIANSVEQAEHGGRLRRRKYKGGDYGPYDIDGYMPDFGYLAQLNNKQEEADLASAFTNLAANNWVGQSDKTPFTNRVAEYNSDLKGFPIGGKDYTDSLLPPIEELHAAVGNDPELFHTLATRLYNSAYNQSQQSWFPIDLHAEMASRLNDYHSVLSGSGLKKKRVVRRKR